jgi:hypothetical protein
MERYFDDDGEAIHPHLTPTPQLCFSCSQYDTSDGRERMLCNLTRADKQINEVFVCFAYRPVSPDVDRAVVLRELCEKAGIEFSEDDLLDAEDDEPVSF